MTLGSRLRTRAIGRSKAGADRVSYAANPLLVVRLPAWRSRVLLLLLFTGFLALAIRAVHLQGGAGANFLQRQGEVRYARTLDVPGTRGKVLDRNGVVLAASVPARAVWAIPDDVDASPEQLARLARLLQMPLAELKRRLADEDSKFTFLRRQVDLSVARQVEAMKLDGIHQSPEFKRHYPEGPAVAHVTGFTNVEDRGQEGVELSWESVLAARTGSRRVIKDRLGNVIEEDWLLAPADGNDVRLSIDSRIQFIAFSALKGAIETHKARAGAVVVLDVGTGEILALANWPSFDPNARGAWHKEAVRNRVITDTFEPGSTMKPFTIAAALETGKVTPQQAIQTAPGKLTIGGQTIGDAHPHGVLTVAEVVAKSSNVGTVRIAMQLPAQKLWDAYTAAGFGQPVRIGFPGAAPGRLRPARTWREVEQATISYGYGISVSLMQLARAYMVFARDGDTVPVSLTRVDGAPAGIQVMRPETVRAVRHMLELAASEEGTAPQARVAGYRVAGKTGTARKVRDGRYVNEYVASFAGFAPASNPRIVVAVMIDEPGGGRYYGGDVAAPVFARIATASLRTLQVAPDALPAEPGPGPVLAQTERVRNTARREGL
jgi:cell division protein FtsI (penicillin-binding protein 3)